MLDVPSKCSCQLQLHLKEPSPRALCNVNKGTVSEGDQLAVFKGVFLIQTKVKVHPDDMLIALDWTH